MKVPNALHERGQWVIRGIAHDLDLLDVWELPVAGGREDFVDFLDTISRLDPTTAGSTMSRALFWFRSLLGTVLGWDDPDARRSIPGSTDASLAERLPEHLRDTGPPISEALRVAGAQPLYRTDDEAAIEISNETVHGVLHLSWVERDGRYRAHMAIYVKPRGRLGEWYLKLIAPFRHVIVYPALMREIDRLWRARRSGPPPG